MARDTFRDQRLTLVADLRLLVLSSEVLYAARIFHSQREWAREQAVTSKESAGVAGGKKAGDTDERLHDVAAWREAPFCTDALRRAVA
ncbi:hypothetical protein TU94_26300 [Streptomyces cyaneogriseus subsp. noncyanogenus]|uniref:Uncharacterized protein n=1 Tax=Streptomyces cyaneogriseus subsp. noncyanogenus TaxID=477245 RepID=A0A0C5GJ40_9ACTN|nr:hypothetical protein [Streptomyces cyaneogriseus]AJP04451.1 hypothetical protein TU94_26300 [Streptomyces cyaneogriseus subsp. noncyanogenus]